MSEGIIHVRMGDGRYKYDGCLDAGGAGYRGRSLAVRWAGVAVRVRLTTERGAPNGVVLDSGLELAG
jgi:hypothetical protein